jgi:topoisomerase IV subunit A
VQRRILHTLWEMDDGRFHKVANVVGATMRYHPHGDASIGAALVGMGQRGWLVEPQGNFGNVLTGDEAAAPRYIEARLTPFAREVLFNPKTTTWQLSYDGRAREPVTLPAKFPIVLLEGAEGIAVGLSTKILPHNFNDLCRAAINHLQGKTLPDLPGFSDGRHRRLLRVQRRRARRQGEDPRADRGGARCSSRSRSCPTGRRPSP